MRTAFVAAAIALAGVASPAVAGEYTFCLLLNKVSAAGKLVDYTDRQVENGLCMAASEVAKAIAAKNSLKESICLQSAEHMMREFKRRFPKRNPGEVAGRC